MNQVPGVRPFRAALSGAARLLRSAGRTPDAMIEPLEQRLVLAADLTATMVAAPFTGTSASGGAMIGTLTLRNTGDAAAANFAFQIVLSSDTILGNEDDIILGGETIASLAAGGILTRSLGSYTIPAGVNPGSYFLLAGVDTGGVIAENNEANNQWTSAGQIATLNGPAGGPNLTVTNLVYTGGTFNPDSHFAATATIRNSGTGSPTNFRVVWIMSTDRVIGNSDDIEVDSEDFTQVGGLAAGQSVALTRDIQFPIGIGLGSYYFAARVDSQDQISETNEADNTFTSLLPNVALALPDLTGSFAYVGGTFAAGATLTGTLTIRNLSAAPAAPFRVYVCLSPDNIARNGDDVFLGYYDVRSAANPTEIGLNGLGILTIADFRMVIPDAIAAGTYRITVLTDATGTVTESNEANNDFVSALANVTISAHSQATLADLRVNVFPVIANAAPGGTITINAMLSNAGGVSVTDPFAIRAYLSTDGTLSAEDFLLSGDIFAGQQLPVLPGSYYLTRTVTLPSTTPAGLFYVILQVDPAGVIVESNTSNNTGATALRQVTTTRPVIAVVAADPAAGESGGIANPGAFTFTRTGPLTAPLTVNITVAGTATSGVDFTALPATITFAAGSAVATLSLAVLEDTLGEPNETVIVGVGLGSGYNVSTFSHTATVTIADNEPRVSVVASDPLAGEGSIANPGLFTFTRVGGNLAQPLTIFYTITGTATSGTDYAHQPSPGSITIPAGALSVTLAITGIVDDQLVEDGETVVLTIQPHPVYSTGTDTATITIADNEPTVTIAALTPIITEAGPVARFQFLRVGGTLSQSVTVNYTLSGTAATGTDFTTPSGTITINANSATAILEVPILEDQLAEDAETIIVTLGNGTEYRLSTLVAQRSATATITDNESMVVIAALTPSASESAPLNTARFQVTRIGGLLNQAITVTYTLSGTAVAGSDFTAPTGSITIPSGALSAVIEVPVTDDALVESTESVIVTLDAGTSYRLSTLAVQRAGTATITDNEPTILIAALTPIVQEHGPLNLARYQVTRLFGSNAGPLTVSYTLSGTATDTADYTTPSGTVTFAAGAATAVIEIPVAEDSLVENAETIVVTLGASPAYRLGTAAQQTATASIADNEPTVTIAALTPIVGESGVRTARFQLTRTGGPITGTLAVNYSTGGTATSVDDYTAPSGTVTFAAGSATAVIEIPITDDTVGELNETLILTLTPDTSYRLSTLAVLQSATATITDNEPVISVLALDPLAGDDNPINTGTFHFTRTGGNLTQTLTINILVSGTATSGTDYNALPATITFAANSATATLLVTPLLDALADSGETVIVRVDTGTGYRAASATGATVTINDTGRVVSVSASDPLAAEGTPTNAGTFTFTRTGSTAASVDVLFQLGGNAASGDYTVTGALPGIIPGEFTVTIPAGAASAVVTITPTADSTAEVAERVELTLVDTDDYNLGVLRTAVVTIAESGPSVSVAAIDPVASEGTGALNQGVFRFTRTGPTTDFLDVFVTLTGTINPAADFGGIGGAVVRIPAGALFFDAVFNFTQDHLTEPTETLIATIDAMSTYRIAAGALGTATMQVLDVSPTVSIAAIDPFANEGAGTLNQGVFRISRTGPTTEALTVNLTRTGTAADADFAVIPGASIIIPIGAAFLDVPMNFVQDNTDEPGETVIWTIAADPSYRILGTGAATLNVADVTPTVTIAAIDPIARETLIGAAVDRGAFRITRTGGDLTQPLVVTIGVTGTADALDWSQPRSVVYQYTIAAGQSFVDAFVNINDDTAAEPTETLIFTIQASPTYRLSPVVATRSATVQIGDNEPIVTLAAIDPVGVETSPGTTANPAMFRFTRTGSLAESITVGFSLAGTATNGVDYNLGAASVTFAAGAATADVPVTILPDTITELTETIVLSMLPTIGTYTVGTLNTATVSIVNAALINLGITQLDVVGQSSFGVATPGQVLNANFTYVNTGVNAVPSATARFYLSSDGVFGNSDDIILRNLALTNIPAGASVQLMLTFALDQLGFLPLGQYNLGVIIFPGTVFSLTTAYTDMDLSDNQREATTHLVFTT